MSMLAGNIVIINTDDFNVIEIMHTTAVINQHLKLHDENLFRPKKKLTNSTLYTSFLLNTKYYSLTKHNFIRPLPKAKKENWYKRKKGKGFSEPVYHPFGICQVYHPKKNGNFPEINSQKGGLTGLLRVI
jgi:hypothetical protein